MASLRSLFDFQKIDENSELDSLIQETQMRYPGVRELSEDELDMVAAGRNIRNKNSEVEKSN